MPIEIERKFLTLSDGWRAKCTGSIRLADGLIASEGGRKVRVRIAGERGYLTVKGARTGFSRDEYEYEIPLSDAEHMLQNHCANIIVTKTRYFVLEDGFIFEVDVYEGILEGVIIAEAELTDPKQEFPRPIWLGEEVTGREEYRKINLLRARLKERSA